MKIHIVCPCGYLIKTTNPKTNATENTTCPNCKKKVVIRYSNGNAFVAYKG